jgi:hypothetical protein
LYLDNSSTCFDSAQHKSLGIKVKDVAAKKEILGLLLKRICIKKAAVTTAASAAAALS